MPDENITSVIDNAFTDNAVEMRNALYNAINDKIFAALDQRKQEVARNFLAQYDDQEDENTEETVEDESEETVEDESEESVEDTKEEQ
jgi:hypothetical protein